MRSQAIVFVDPVEILRSATFLEQKYWFVWVALCRAAVQLALEFSDQVGEPGGHIGAHLACAGARQLGQFRALQTYWLERCWCAGRRWLCGNTCARGRGRCWAGLCAWGGRWAWDGRWRGARNWLWADDRCWCAGGGRCGRRWTHLGSGNDEFLGTRARILWHDVRFAATTADCESLFLDRKKCVLIRNCSNGTVVFARKIWIFQKKTYIGEKRKAQQKNESCWFHDWFACWSSDKWLILLQYISTVFIRVRCDHRFHVRRAGSGRNRIFGEFSRKAIRITGSACTRLAHKFWRAKQKTPSSELLLLLPLSFIDDSRVQDLLFVWPKHSSKHKCTATGEYVCRARFSHPPNARVHCATHWNWYAWDDSGRVRNALLDGLEEQ